jgi:hypothetical protein
MYSEFNAKRSPFIAAQKDSGDRHMSQSPSLATDGFNLWWAKTEALNMATLSEASDLMRAHRLNSACQPRTLQAQRVSEDHHGRS